MYVIKINGHVMVPPLFKKVTLEKSSVALGGNKSVVIASAMGVPSVLSKKMVASNVLCNRTSDNPASKPCPVSMYPIDPGLSNKHFVTPADPEQFKKVSVGGSGHSGNSPVSVSGKANALSVQPVCMY